MTNLWFLQQLGLTAGADQRAIKRAYAAHLKQIDQSVDIEGFNRLRRAYEMALRWSATAVQRDTTRASPEPGVSDEPEIPRTGSGRVLREEMHAAARVAANASARPSNPGASANSPGDGQDAPPVDPPLRQALHTAARQVAEAPSRALEPVADAEEKRDIDPQEIVNHALRTLTQRLLDGEPPAQVLADTARALQHGQVQLTMLFELALIDALAQARLATPLVLFHSARDWFAWSDIGHLNALGPRGRWVHAVSSEEAAWHAQSGQWRGSQWFEYLEHTPSVAGLTSALAGQWPRLAQQLQHYPNYLRIKIGPAVLDAWHKAFAALPTLDRDLADTYARMPSPAAFRKAVPKARRGPSGGTAYGLVMALFLALRLLNGWMDSPNATAHGGRDTGFQQTAGASMADFTGIANARTCSRLERWIHSSGWTPPASAVQRQQLATLAQSCLRQQEWPNWRMGDPQLAALGVSS